MKAFIVVQDESGGEVRLPLSAVDAVKAMLADKTPPTSTSAPSSTAELKEAAVRRYLSSRCTVVELANELQVPYHRVSKWIRDALGTADRRFLRQAL